MIRLLIVDDSALMRRLLSEIFNEATGFEIAIARTGEEALQSLETFAPDVITLDIHMPGMDGLACLDRIMVERPTPVVMVSSLTQAGAEETLEALALGAVDFIAKPRGAMSLEIETISQDLIEKVRSAANARIPGSARLSDKVRMRARIGKEPAITVLKKTHPSHRKVRPDQTALSGIEAVLVGVSTGGPPALDALLQPLPGTFPWPLVIAQHMPATFTGPLARRLDRGCALDVVEVCRAVPLERGKVYIGRGDADLVFSRRNGAVQLLAAPKQTHRLWHPSADRLVESARTVFAPSALIGVLMTGMGSDGAAAMAQLQRDGGHVIAQDKESSVVWGMPGTLVAAGGTDLILPLTSIAPQLMAWAR